MYLKLIEYLNNIEYWAFRCYSEKEDSILCNIYSLNRTTKQLKTTNLNTSFKNKTFRIDFNRLCYRNGTRRFYINSRVKRQYTFTLRRYCQCVAYYEYKTKEVSQRLKFYLWIFAFCSHFNFKKFCLFKVGK